MSGNTIRPSRIGIPPVSESPRVTTRVGQTAVQGMAANLSQLSQLTANTENVVQTYATVLSVTLPDTYEQQAIRQPVSTLGAEGAQTSELVRLCRIVYADMTCALFERPTVLGAEARGSNAALIEMHESLGKVCYPRTADLAVPSPGDIIIVQYMDTGDYSSPIYIQHYISTPNPGSAASMDMLSMLGGSLPTNSLEDYSSEEFNEELITEDAPGGGSIGEGWKINDPESDHYQLALTYANHYDTQTYTDDNRERNLRQINQLHDCFKPYVKAFIAICNREDIQITANSSYRTVAYQRELRANYDALSPAEKAVTAAPARGISYHNLGLAFDFNAHYSGTRLNSNPSLPGGSLGEWTSSGLPTIVKDLLGLKWGGDLSLIHI